jgi:prolyl 4-hydroxylase
MIFVYIITLICIIALYTWIYYYSIEPDEELMITEELEIQGHKIIRHSYKGFKVLEIYDILTEKECQNAIDLAERTGLNIDTKFTRSSENGYKIENKSGLFTRDSDPVYEKISKITSILSKIPIEEQEPAMVAKYIPGGRISPHFDPCSPGSAGCSKRKVTHLIYLNDNFEGGETHFVNLNLKIKPETGKSILFWNHDDNGDLFEVSLHQGMPVKNGMKYICTQWT